VAPSAAPIAEVNAGLATFATQVRANPTTAARLDVAVVGFDSAALVRRDFALLDEGALPTLSTGGSCTNLVAGVDRALALLAERKRWYDEVGLPRYRGYLLVITDGASRPTPAEELAVAPRAAAPTLPAANGRRSWAFGTTGAALHGPPRPVRRRAGAGIRRPGLLRLLPVAQYLLRAASPPVARARWCSSTTPDFFRHTI
jgi:hypothetical protein